MLVILSKIKQPMLTMTLNMLNSFVEIYVFTCSMHCFPILSWCKYFKYFRKQVQVLIYTACLNEPADDLVWMNLQII